MRPEPEFRLRKAWQVWATWQDPWTRTDVTYAPTASRAKALVWSQMMDCSYEGNVWAQLRARRWPERDILLPDLHPSAEPLSAKERHIISHAYGSSGRSEGYRSHFVTHPGDLELLRLAWVEGMFDGPFAMRGSRERALDGTPDLVVFTLSNLGKEVARSLLPTYHRYA